MAEISEYQLKKNSGANFEKDHARNRLIDRMLREILKNGRIIKLYHFQPMENIEKEKQNELESRTLGADFQPFVVYSLNRRKRWEAFHEIDNDFMNHLNDFNGELENVILEREYQHFYSSMWCKDVHAYQNHRDFSKVKAIHALKNDDLENEPHYSKTIFSGKGSWYKRENEISTPIVTYNVINFPKNSKKLFDSSCQRFNGYCYFSRYSIPNKKNNKWIKKLDDLEFESSDTDITDDDPQEINNKTESFYNLSDHFVMKKSRNRTRKSSVSSEYSIIDGPEE